MEQNQIIVKNGGAAGVILAGEVKHLESFTEKLNKKPSKIEQAQGYDTIPIDTIETELDEDFMGLWQTENFRWQVIANEIVGTIDLLVFHPVAKTWLRKTGTASTLIRQKSGADLQDIGAKIKNGLVMDFPKLEIMCIKSAAKKLGEKYGRSLNRKLLDSYEPIYSQEIEATDAISIIGEQMQTIKDLDGLKKVWEQNPDLHSNPHFKNYFSANKKRIQLKTAK